MESDRGRREGEVGEKRETEDKRYREGGRENEKGREGEREEWERRKRERGFGCGRRGR